MKKLKVYGGASCQRMIFKQARQVRVLVCAHSKSHAVQILNDHGYRVNSYEFNGWWTETHNEHELATATEIGVWESDLHKSIFERFVPNGVDFERVATNGNN